ncbi:hypothetical protein [Dyadobacter sp. 50-39]|jgi:hypothetical protein|uniref:hypothetical protein n=1 Tax=unclassified Dyadobacter TaxID=2625061 RepID=UPI0025B93E61|nr:hypothetical protein [Dyadobacter sp. 50-39]
MKRKVLGLVTAVMFFTAGSMYAFSPLQDKCPDKGTAKCKLVKNCPDKGTSKCKLVDQKKVTLPSCCQKSQETASVKKASSKLK